MKKLSLLLLLTLIIGSCAKEDQKQGDVEQQKLVSIEEIQKTVETELEKGKVFYWKDVDDHFIWSAGMHSDALFSIGYTIGSSFDAETQMKEVDIKSEAWKKAKNEVLNLILDKEAITRQNPNLSVAGKINAATAVNSI